MHINIVNSVPYPVPQHVIGMWTAALLSLALIPTMWRSRKQTGGIALIVLLLSMAIWNVFTGLEYLSTTLSAKIFWMRFAYIGICAAPSCTLLASRIFCGDDSSLLPVFRLLLIAVPVVAIIVMMTNTYHGLFWRSMAIDPVNGAGLWEFGVAFYVWAGFSYLALFAALFVIVRAIFVTRGMYRAQAIGMLLALLPPWIVNAIYISGVGMGIVQGYDLTPLASGVTVIFLAINRWAFHFMDRVPVARQRVLDAMRQGLLVVDENHIILDANQLLCDMVKLDKFDILGKDLCEVFPQYSVIWDEIYGMERPRHMEYEFEDIGYLAVDMSPVYRKDRHITGWIALVENITTRVQAEQDLLAAHNALEMKVEALEQARYAIKTLGNLVPVCAECGRQAQMEDGSWVEISHFIELHSESQMTHGICPECLETFNKH